MSNSHPAEETHIPVSRRGFLHAALFGSLALTGPAWAVDAPLPPELLIPTMNPRLFTFVAGEIGSWRITEIKAISGDGLPVAHRLEVVKADGVPLVQGVGWMLRGVTSNERYVTRTEKDELVAKQPALSRPEADCAVLIPIRKNARWWAMTPDERRKIFEEQSHHNAIGLQYLPAIARRLHHCRDLGEAEPFDFLTWFEFAKAETAAFDRLLGELRATPEWKFVEREVEVRVTRQPA